MSQEENDMSHEILNQQVEANEGTDVVKHRPSEPLDELYELLKKRFHKPDLQAVRIVLGTANYHYLNPPYPVAPWALPEKPHGDAGATASASPWFFVRTLSSNPPASSPPSPSSGIQMDLIDKLLTAIVENRPLQAGLIFLASFVAAKTPVCSARLSSSARMRDERELDGWLDAHNTKSTEYVEC